MFKGIDNQNLVYQDGEWRLRPSSQPTYRVDYGKGYSGQINGRTLPISCLHHLYGSRYVIYHFLENYSAVYDCETHAELLRFPTSSDETYNESTFFFYRENNEDEKMKVLNLETLEFCDYGQHSPFIVHVTPGWGDFNPVKTVVVDKYYDCKGVFSSIQLSNPVFETVQTVDQYLLIRYTELENAVVIPGSEFTFVPMVSEVGVVFEMTRIKTTTKPAIRNVEN